MEHLFIGYRLLILLMGKLVNGTRKGRMVAIGYFIYAAGALSFLLVHNEQTLIAALMFNALSAGITLPAYEALFAKNETRGRESERWSWLYAGNMFAAALGAAIGGVVIGAFSFKGLFVTMAAIQFIAAVVAYKAFYNRL